jgi:hypothetical protein
MTRVNGDFGAGGAARTAPAIPLAASPAMTLRRRSMLDCWCIDVSPADHAAGVFTKSRRRNS